MASKRSSSHLALPPFLHLDPSYQSNVYSLLARREDARYTIARASYSGHSTMLQDIARKHPAWDCEAFAAREAMRERNIERNRYGDILPYDRTRVVLPPANLSSQRSESDSYSNGNAHDDYLNASWISLSTAPITWIATQAPLPHTVHDFLSLFLADALTLPDGRKSSSPRTVVMLTGCVESGRTKSERYWPHNVGESTTFRQYVPSFSESGGSRSRRAKTDWKDGPKEPITVTYVDSVPSRTPSVPRKNGFSLFKAHQLPSGAEEQHKGWRTNTLRIFTPSGKSAEVGHVEYLGWKDHGVPDDPGEVLALIEHLERIGPSSQDEPLVAHCSAGVGRTGTLIALCTLIPLLQRYRAANEDGTQSLEQACADLTKLAQDSPLGNIVSAQQEGKSELQCDPVVILVDLLRDRRTTMVQTQGQLEFIYSTLRLWWKNQ